MYDYRRYICTMPIEQGPLIKWLGECQKRTTIIMSIETRGRWPLQEKYLPNNIKAKFWRLVLGD